DHADGLRHGERPVGEEAVRERAPVDPLDDEDVSFGALEDVVDLADPRMVESRESARLAPHALAQHGAAGALGAQELQCDTAPEARVERAVDAPHPTLADEALDAKRTDPFGGHLSRKIPVFMLWRHFFDDLLRLN